jgi:hypothetical protein
MDRRTPMLNEPFGWLWITVGFLTGVGLGLGFEREEFMGGYGAWRRRLCRLGHVCFYALGALNILFAFSMPRLGLDAPWPRIASLCLIAGAILMPACCFLAAWRKPLARLFPAPVLLLVAGGTITWVGMFLGVVR